MKVKDRLSVTSGIHTRLLLDVREERESHRGPIIASCLLHATWILASFVAVPELALLPPNASYVKVTTTKMRTAKETSNASIVTVRRPFLEAEEENMTDRCKTIV
jgi:hypothetical protein